VTQKPLESLRKRPKNIWFLREEHFKNHEKQQKILEEIEAEKKNPEQDKMPQE